MSSIGDIVIWASQAIEHIIAWGGYAGVIVLMALESCNIPIPSEVILTFAGYLVQQGQMDFHLTALAGALGCVVETSPFFFAECSQLLGPLYLYQQGY